MTVIQGFQRPEPVYKPVRRFTPQEMKEQNLPGMGSGSAFAEDPPGTPAVLIQDGKLVRAERENCIYGGSISDERARDVKFVTYNGDLGGIMVTGPCRYEIDRATMSLSGKCLGLGKERSGVYVHGGADVTLRESNIYVNGQRRSCFCVYEGSVLRAYNSTFICMGAPFGKDCLEPQETRFRGQFGCTWDTARTSDMQDNSQEYFYDCTIIGDGCCALSIDGSQGFNRMEAQRCRMVTTKGGYGVYSDTFCHLRLKDCDMDIADTAAVMAGEGDLSFENTRIRTGGWLVNGHCIVSLPSQRSSLFMKDCDCDCVKEAFSIRSCNLYAVVDGCTIRTESGVLLRSIYNTSTQPRAVHPAEGEQMYGIHLYLKNSVYNGDILHEDPQRECTVYLEN